MAKHTIYLNDSIMQIIKAFGQDNSLSGSISAIIERYDKITKEAVPTLARNEWMSIADVLNGCGALLPSGGHDQAPMLWAEIMDAEPDGIGEKWKVSCRALSDKLRALPLAGRCAVWDVAARFWENEGGLEAAGAKIGNI